MKKRIFLFTLAFVLLLPSCGKVADPSPVVPSENSSELSVEKTSEEKPSDADAPLSSDASSGEVPTPPQTNELPDDGIYTHGGFTFTYEVNPDGQTCTVTGLKDPDFENSDEPRETLEIPYFCDRYRITDIGERAFYSKPYVEHVKILATNLNTIGKEAFSSCNALLTVQAKVESIGERAFEFCGSLYRYSGQVKEIGDYAFNECFDLCMVDFVPEHIGKEAFCYCRALRTFDFSNLDSLGKGAFSNAGLETLAIGVNAYGEEKSKITSLPESAFVGCPLRYIMIGGQIKEVGAECFTLFNEKINACPQFVFFMEGVEKIGTPAMTFGGDKSHPGAVMFLPSSLKSIDWKTNSYYDGEALDLFYAGSQEAFEKIQGISGKPLDESFTRTTFHFDYSYPYYVLYEGEDWPC